MSLGKKVTIKLIINKNTKKVVYAEAGKDCVDFLFHVLVLPVGAALKHMLKDADDAGCCLGNLYKSVGEFNPDLFQTFQTKDVLLNPRAESRATYCVPLWAKNDLGAPHSIWSAGQFYTTHADDHKPPPGYVKPHATYMVTDDLVVKPLSSDSVLTLLRNNPDVKDLTCLEGMDVSIDANQAMALLRASLFSKTILTDTFLKDYKSNVSDPNNI